VVVDNSYQKLGIGTAFMHEIFSNDELKSIQNWILFTDTAKNLYEKFGFVTMSEILDRKIVCKIRIQEKHPEYMDMLLNTIHSGLPGFLKETQSLDFLFREKGRRINLSEFWKETKK